MSEAIDEGESYDLSVMSRSELEAEIVSQAKILERFRSELGGIVMGLQDEGDRVYFGSTNEADWLREIEGQMLASLNELEMPWMHGCDLYADLRTARECFTASQSEVADLKREVERYREIVRRFGDRISMANAPAHLQQDIDAAFAEAAQ